MVDRHLEALDRGIGEGWRQWKLAAAWRRKRGLTCGAYMSIIGKREGSVAQRCKLMRETYSNGDAKGARAYRSGWVRQRPQRGSGLARWTVPVGLGSREGFKMGMDFQISNEFRIWQDFEEFTRRFRRNLDKRIFPKFF
jgi:hypothetical protein